MSVWNESNIATLKTLWREGFSAGEIAKKLGIRSRSAVIGKVHRMGLTALGRLPAAKPPGGRKGGLPPGRAPRPAKAPPVARDARQGTSAHNRTRAMREPGYTQPSAHLDRVKAMQPGPFARAWETRRPGECAWPHGERYAVQSCCAPCEGSTYCADHRRFMTQDTASADRSIERAVNFMPVIAPLPIEGVACG